MVVFYLAIVVSVFVLFSISSGSFNSECFVRGGGGDIHRLLPSFSCGFVLVDHFLVFLCS